MKVSIVTTFLYRDGNAGIAVSPTPEKAAAIIINRCNTYDVVNVNGWVYVDGRSTVFELPGSKCIQTKDEYIRHFKWDMYYFLGFDGNRFLTRDEIDHLRNLSIDELAKIRDSL